MAEERQSLKPLSVQVGARFFDANLRKHALDTFTFRPLPQDMNKPYPVKWPNQTSQPLQSLQSMYASPAAARSHS